MKNLNRLFLVAVVVIACSFLFFACSDADEPGNIDDIPAEIQVTVADISVDASSVKLNYSINEALNLEGLSVKIVKSDGTEVTIAAGADGYSIDSSLFNSAQAGEYVITVVYGDFRKTFTVTVTAAEPVSYNVTLDTNGGQQLTRLTYKSGDTLTLPEPSYGDNVFLGWYLDKGTWQNKMVSGVVNRTESFTLYARWGVYITYDCAGGTEVQRSLIDLGATLDNLPATYKNGFIHAGWYYDELLTNKAWEGDSVSGGMLLHAKFSASNAGVISKMKLVEDVTDTSVIIESTLVLTEANIADYISVSSTGGEAVALNVGDGGQLNYYKLTSLDYIDGKTYVMKLLTDEINFVKIGDTAVDFDTTQLSFNVYKQNHSNVTMKDVKHVKLIDVAMFKEGIYVLDSNDADNGKKVNSLLTFKKDGISYSVGDIISLSAEDTTGDEDLFYKIIGVNEETWGYALNANESVVDTDFYYLEVVEADLEDIYSSFDAFSSGKLKLQGLVTLSTESVAESASSSEALKSINKAFRRSVPKMPSMVALSAKMDETDRAALAQAMSAFEFSIKDIYVGCPTDDSVKLRLAFEYAITISNICTITFGMSFEDTISINFSYNLTSYKDGIINKYLIELYTDLANEFKLSLSAEIQFTHDAINLYGSSVTGGADGKQDKVDLFDEISTIMDSENLSALKEAIQGNPLEGEEDAYEMEYQELLNVPMATIPIPVTNIITFEISFNAVVEVGAKAGIYIDISQAFVEQTRIANGEVVNGVITPYEDGFRLTQKELKSDFALAVTLKGKFGVRCGIQAKFSVGIAHTNSLASAYIAMTFGPYIELSGIFRYEYKYDAVRSISSSELLGGMFFEAGLYLDLKVGVNLLSIESETSLWSKQFPFFRVGDIRSPIRFSSTNYRPNSDKSYASESVRSRSHFISYAGGMLNVDYLNLDTGEEVKNVKPTWLSFEYSVNEGYEQLVSVDSAKRRITIKPEFTGTTLYFEIVAEFKGSGTSFAKDMRIVLCYNYYDSSVESGTYYQYGVYTFKNSYMGEYDNLNDTIEQKVIYMGLPITSPIVDESQFPVRHGYYLDLDDLWIKKDAHGNVDESFDGNFGDASIENNYAFYHLKWKKRTFTAKIYAPVYNSTGVRTDWVSIDDDCAMYFSGHPYRPNSAYSFFFVEKSSDAIVPEFFGRIFKGMNAPNYRYISEYEMGEGNLDVPAGNYYKLYFDPQNSLEESFVKLDGNTVSFYLDYEKQVFQVFYNSPNIAIGVRSTYCPADKGLVAWPALDVPWQIGDPIITIHGGSYEVTGYRDIDTNTIYTDVSQMPVVNKTFNYEVLCSGGYYAVNYVTDGGVCLYSRHLNSGDVVPAPVLNADFYAKINQRDWLYFVGYNYEFVLPENPIEIMPAHDIDYVLTINYLPEERTVTFNGFDAERNYVFTTESSTNGDGKPYIAFTGKTTKRDYEQTYEETHFTAPELKPYIDEATGKRYVFKHWSTNVGYRRLIGHNTQNEYYVDCTYTPVFTVEDVEFAVSFRTTSSIGYQLFFRYVEGALFGKTLKEVIDEYEVGTPTRKDYNGVHEYTFANWGVNAETLIFGNEYDQNGDLKTYYFFNAVFTENKQQHNVVLHANGGKFPDGYLEETMTVSGAADEVMSIYDIAMTRESDELGSYRFVGWSYTETYNPSHPATISPNKCYPVGGAELYAAYALSLYERTVTVTGSVKEGDDTITAYFGGIESQTQIGKPCYDGEIFSVRKSTCYFSSTSSYYRVVYLSWMVGEEEHRAYPDEYGFLNVTVNGDMAITAVYAFDRVCVYNVKLLTTGYCLYEGEIDEEYEPTGYYGHYLSNTSLNKEYGTTMEAPFVIGRDPTDVFVGWAKSGAEGPDFDNLILAGDTITFDSNQVYYALYEYDETKEICLTFYARQRTRENDTDAIKSCEYFADGSTVLTNYGATNAQVIFALEPHKEGYNFVGWTDDDINTYQASELTYVSEKNYYAVYTPAAGYSLTLKAGEGGNFAGEAEFTTAPVISGTLASALEKPSSNDDKKVFSHYEDANGNVLYYVTGTGTYFAKYAYPVSDFDSLCAINNNLTADYVLTQDISIPQNYSDPIVEWTALGADSANGFSGTFNGNGHLLEMYVEYRGVNAGLFAKISGRVFSLCFISGGDVNSSETTTFGGIAGELAAGGLIENCAVDRTISCNVVNNKDMSIGGLVGINSGTIKGISMKGSSFGVGLDCASANVGGVVGTNNGTLSNVLDVYTAVGIGLYSGTIVRSGALVGYNNGTVIDCISEKCPVITFANGDNYFAANSVLVGVVGYNNGTFEHCRLDWFYPQITIEKMLIEGEIAEVYYDIDDSGFGWYSIHPRLISVRYNEEHSFPVGEEDNYHFSEYATLFPAEAAKLDAIKNAVCFSASCNGIEAVDFKMADDLDNVTSSVFETNFDMLSYGYVFRLREEKFLNVIF